MNNSTWIAFLNQILRIPGARINRKAFLRKTFRGLSEKDLQICISESPVKIVPIHEIEKAANSVINWHTTKVTTLSAISGIPGGFAMIATIPADLANYYYHIVSVGQKLGYLYGFPDMIDENDKLTKDGEIMLTAFIGVMNNVKVANEIIKNLMIELTKRISEETALRVARNIMTKQIFAQAIESIATKLGTKITAKTAGKGLYRAIPLLSGIICGGITYATFKPEAKRLHEALKNNLVDTQAILISK